MWPFTNSTLSRRPRRRFAREVEHLVGHVEPDRPPGQTDAPSADQYVRAGAGAEIEHGLALVESATAVGRHSRATRPRLREARPRLSEP